MAALLLKGWENCPWDLRVVLCSMGCVEERTGLAPQYTSRSSTLPRSIAILASYLKGRNAITHNEQGIANKKKG